MTQLHEEYRPREWSEVVGQDKVISSLFRLRLRGLSGRSYWLSGQSGTGKTTIAKLLAKEVADDWSTIEIDGGQVDTALLDDLDRQCRQRPFGKGYCLIVNEAHGLRSAAIRRLLVILESLPAWVTVIFTTTNDAQDILFDEQVDSHPLLSRCTVLPLARRDLAKAFAERARMIAQKEGMDGKPIADYVRLVQKHRQNLRAVLQEIESGCMCAASAELGAQ